MKGVLDKLKGELIPRRIVDGKLTPPRGLGDYEELSTDFAETKAEVVDVIENEVTKIFFLRDFYSVTVFKGDEEPVYRGRE